jgi:hypothetical protein
MANPKPGTAPAEKAKPSAPVDTTAHCHIAWSLLAPALELAEGAGNKDSIVPADSAVRLEISDQMLNVQAGVAPDLFFEVNVSMEVEAELPPVFVKTANLRKVLAEAKKDSVITLGRAAGGRLLVGFGNAHFDLVTVTGDGFVTPLLADDEECDASADVTYTADLLRSALDWTLDTVPDDAKKDLPHGIVFDGDICLGIEGKRMNLFPKMPEPFGKGKGNGKAPVLPSKAAGLVQSVIELLNADEVPACFMHVPKRGDFFAFQFHTKHFGAAVVAKGTGEKVPDYRKALPKGRPLAAGTLDVQGFKAKLALASKLILQQAGEDRGVRLTLTQGELVIETVVGEKSSRDSVHLAKRDGAKQANGLFVETSRWLNPEHLTKALGLLKKAEKVNLILPLADELDPKEAVVSLQDPSGRLAVIAPKKGDKAAVALLAKEREASAEKPAAKGTAKPVAKPEEKKADDKKVVPVKALPAPKALPAHQPA